MGPSPGQTKKAKKKKDLGATPGGSEVSSEEDEDDEGFAQFKQKKVVDKRYGPVPGALSDDDRTKLHHGMKVGIFYYQYTLLKKTVDQDQLDAPRLKRHDEQPDGEKRNEELSSR